jgi:hypothetical protein
LLPYIILFAFFALGALLLRPEPEAAAGQGGEAATFEPVPQAGLAPVMLWLGSLLTALLIGLRYEVGADWSNYEAFFRRAGRADLGEILALDDPAYQLLNWVAQQLDLRIWSVNLVCGAIFSWGLFRFARSQPFPWLVAVVAIPYLVTVVAMGYSRQAVAMGLLMGGIASIIRGGSLVRFVGFAVLAALFHQTSILVLPLVIFAAPRNRLLTLIGGLGLIYGLYSTLLAQDVDRLVRGYIEAAYSSQGALIRVLMSLVPGLFYFALRRKLAFSPFEYKLWGLHSWAAVALLVAYYLSPSSTAVDRIALYIIPLQLAIMARLPLAFPVSGIRLAVVGYALAILLVWLNFAAHARYWVPYSFYPF